MTTFFDRVESISDSTKYLINGYIRQCQNELFGDFVIYNPYYNIPQPVNNLCMLFYQLWTWHKQNYGQGLKFLSDTEVTTEEDGIWSTCLFENVISHAICDRFSITFKIKSFGKWEPGDMVDKETPDFYIGYTTGQTIDDSILNWHHQLGEDKNALTSCAWNVYGNALYFFGEGRSFAKVARSLDYAIGDLLKLVIDFEGKTITIYYNDIEANSRKLDVKQLWIGFSIAFFHNTIEMVHYKYD